MVRIFSTLIALALLTLAGCGGGPAVQPVADQTAPEIVADDAAPESAVPAEDMAAAPADEAVSAPDAAMETVDEPTDEIAAEQEAAAIEAAPAVQVVEPVMVNVAQLTLQNGMKIRGLIRMQNNKEVTIETAFGKATFPAKRVVKIEYIQVPVGGPSADPKGMAAGG